MTERAKQLYQIAQEKFNSINEELRTLNKDYHPVDEEDEADMYIGEECRDDTLYNFRCLLESFDDDYLNMFSICFDAEIEQDSNGEWDCNPFIVLTPKHIPCLDIMIGCPGYYINGGGEPCDPTANCLPAARALVAKYKKQYEEFLKECKLFREDKTM